MTILPATDTKADINLSAKSLAAPHSSTVKAKLISGTILCCKQILNVVKQPCLSIAAWYRVLRDSRMLSGLNDRALRDIGIDRATVEDESSSGFWRL